MSRKQLLSDARMEQFQEGDNLSNNRFRSPGHSTFGKHALGPLTEDFFPIDQREAAFVGSHLGCTFEEHELACLRSEGDDDGITEEDLEAGEARLYAVEPGDPPGNEDFY